MLKKTPCKGKQKIPYLKKLLLTIPPPHCPFLHQAFEAEFLDVIGRKILRVSSLLLNHSHLYYAFYVPPPIPLPLEQKWF
jgi:hypothetical protein